MIDNVFFKVLERTWHCFWHKDENMRKNKTLEEEKCRTWIALKMKIRTYNHKLTAESRKKNATIAINLHVISTPFKMSKWAEYDWVHVVICHMIFSLYMNYVVARLFLCIYHECVPITQHVMIVFVDKKNKDENNFN